MPVRKVAAPRSGTRAARVSFHPDPLRTRLTPQNLLSPRRQATVRGLISVIISNFNGRRFLPRLLESLRAQTGVELELIVVDRLSTDDSGEFLSVQSDIRMLSEPPESGLVTGYQAGAAAAKGELLFFCNEDMWFAPDCLSRLAERIDLKAHIGAADGWHRTYDDQDWLHRGVRFRSVPWAINSPYPRTVTNFDAQLPDGAKVPFPCAGAFLIHRDTFHELGGWDTSFFLDHEDTDLFLRAWQRGWKCVTVPAARIHHAVNASNTNALPALGTTVARRRYVGQRANLAVIAIKYFRWPAVLLALCQWPVVLLNNVLAGRGAHVMGDFNTLGEIARRLPAAWKFRRANTSWNHYFPGEEYFLSSDFHE